MNKLDASAEVEGVNKGLGMAIKMSFIGFYDTFSTDKGYFTTQTVIVSCWVLTGTQTDLKLVISASKQATNIVQSETSYFGA